MTTVGEGSELISTTHASTTVGIDVPGALTGVRTAESDTVTRIEDVFGPGDLTITVKETGFAIAASIESTSSPHQLDYDVITPEGSILELVDDGSIDVIDDNGFTIGRFLPPWALTSDGSRVETSYKLNGSTIIQTVESVSDDSYPIVSDPEFTWGWISGTIYFNRSETLQICTWGAFAFGVLRLGAPIWAWTVMGAVLTIAAGTIATIACGIYNTGQCLKIKSFSPYIFTHNGNRCT